MEGFLVLGVLLFVVPLVIAIIVIARFGKLRSLVEDLQLRVTDLEARTKNPFRHRQHQRTQRHRLFPIFLSQLPRRSRGRRRPAPSTGNPFSG